MRVLIVILYFTTNVLSLIIVQAEFPSTFITQKIILISFFLRFSAFYEHQLRSQEGDFVTIDNI